MPSPQRSGDLVPSFPAPTRHTACSRRRSLRRTSLCLESSPSIGTRGYSGEGIYCLPRAAGSEFEEYLGTNQSESSIVPTPHGFLQWQLGLQPEQPQGHFYTMGNVTLSKGSAAEKENKNQKTEINYVDVLSCVFAEIGGLGGPLLGGRVPPWTGLGGSLLDWGNQHCSEVQCPTVSEPTLRRAAFFLFSGYFLVLQESDRKYGPCQGIPH